MQIVISTIQNILEQSGLHEVSVQAELEGRRISVIVNEGDWFKGWLPRLVPDINHIANVVAKKNAEEAVFVDVNNYRKERERLITELAKAAARKALTTKEAIKLPPMNAYERRLVHVELATRPDVKTESEGVGDERGVTVRPL